MSDKQPRSPSSSRTARYRARRRHGIVMLRVPAEGLGLAEMLVASGRLRACDVLDRAATEAAVRQLIDDIIREWRKAKFL
jgi:hypothetical protein